MFPKLPDLIPVSDLEEDAVSVLDRVQQSTTPAVITKEGRAAAVLISIEAYEQVEKELEILSLLIRGEREIATGEGFDLESVFAEARRDE
ncbi:MAG TPA: type II toxin-antitoxin system Phd/YefM family antitoxin [Thermoanaerobaculia bacterium]|nr:type II toxin-antitoxin system Phd/YefM family antitoxin [Thermoanaerobaculia bacterium]